MTLQFSNLALLTLLVTGCSAVVDLDPSDIPEQLEERMPVDEVEVVVKGMQGGILDSTIPFMQAGLIFDAEDPTFRFRVQRVSDRQWSSWRNAEITWSEEKYHVGRIILNEPAIRLEFERQAPIEDGKIEFLPEVLATTRLARNLPLEFEKTKTKQPLITSFEDTFPDLHIRQQALAPASLVISRSGWGARSPGKVCGTTHSPYRMSIHHTAAPSTDGSDPAARMRQMQAYHIDSNGWCDLGYHFVTSQSGKIYQGRNHEGRVGAHTGDQNTGSIGISMIGNFEVQNISNAQMNATAAITGWVSRTYGIALNRTRVKGHKEWPGQSTSCPGRNFMGQFGTFLSKAGGSSTAPTPTPTPTPTPAPETIFDVALTSLGLDVESPIDLNGDGMADVCIRTTNGVECRLFDGEDFATKIEGPTLTDSSGWADIKHYATLRFGDLNGDGKSDICARANAGMRCWTFDGTTFSSIINGPEWSDQRGFDKVEYFSTIRMADLNGDGKADLCARHASGLECALSTGTGFGPVFRGPVLQDSDGWNKPEYYATMRFADINGDGKTDLCARAASGIRCWLSNGNGFDPSVSGPVWSNDKGWTKSEYWSTIRLIDLDNDGAADLCARNSAGIVCHLADRTGNFGPEFKGPGLTDASGWLDPANYSTLRFADVTGDGLLDLCGRADAGMVCWPFDGESFGEGWSAGPMKDETGWSHAMYYRTISFADINGDGLADVCARASQGLVCWRSTGTGFDSSLIADSSWSNTAGFSDPKHYSTLRLIGAIRPIASPEPEPSPVEPGPTPAKNLTSPDPKTEEEVDWGDLNEGDIIEGEVDWGDLNEGDIIEPPPESNQTMTSSGCMTSHSTPENIAVLFMLSGILLRLTRRH